MNEATIDFIFIVGAAIILGCNTHWWIGVSVGLLGMAFKPTRLRVRGR